MAYKPQIIGLAGTNGSGKDTVGHLLAEHHGYLFISITELLRSELKRRHIEVTRQHLRELSAEWRRELGLGVLIDKAVAEYNISKNKYTGVVITSLRNPGEADRVHALGGTVVWIDADPRIRYERIQKNAKARGRAGEDNKTFEEFQAEEAAEMSTTGDSATLNMSAVKELSDVFPNNNSPDLETFKQDVEQALGL